MRRLDLVGERRGRLLVVSYLGHSRWECICDCGKHSNVATSKLNDKRSPTRSCGCLRVDSCRNNFTSHGESKGEGPTVEYTIVRGIHARCYNPSQEFFSHYGGRGISVCDRWRTDNPLCVHNFIEDMGRRPSPKHSLDRVDNNGNYCKENCRWATRKEQIRNRRVTLMVEFRGVTKALPDWCDEFGIPYHTAYQRLKRYGYSAEETFRGFCNA